MDRNVRPTIRHAEKSSSTSVNRSSSRQRFNTKTPDPHQNTSDQQRQQDRRLPPFRPSINVPLLRSRSTTTSYPHPSSSSVTNSALTEKERSKVRQTQAYFYRTPSSFSLNHKRRSGRSSLLSSIGKTWDNYKGPLLVVVAQLFGAMMNTTARIIEDEGQGMKPLQILNARMAITVVLSMTYMFVMKIEHAPWGTKEVRGLAVARGIGGFFGVYGLYYSLLYLPVAEATVLTFLAPFLSCFACYFILKEPFSRTEQVAGLLCIFGVVFIAQPTSFFPPSSSNGGATSPVQGQSVAREVTDLGMSVPNVTVSTASSEEGIASVVAGITAAQRLGAIGFAMVGVCGQATAYTTIRWIGKRCHPLITVNYFSICCTIISAISLTLLPDISFRLPIGLREWALLFLLGISGLAMQLLLTAGLAVERSSRATNMVYSEMLFALAFDKLIWGTTPSISSIAGGGLILGSTIYVAVHKARDSSVNTATGQEEETDSVEMHIVDVNEDEAEVKKKALDRKGGENNRPVLGQHRRPSLLARSRSNLGLDGHRMGSRERRKAQQEREKEREAEMQREERVWKSYGGDGTRRRSILREEATGLLSGERKNSRDQRGEDVFDEADEDHNRSHGEPNGCKQRW